MYPNTQTMLIHCHFYYDPKFACAVLAVSGIFGTQYETKRITYYGTLL